MTHLAGPATRRVGKDMREPEDVARHSFWTSTQCGREADETEGDDWESEGEHKTGAEADKEHEDPRASARLLSSEGLGGR